MRDLLRVRRQRNATPGGDARGQIDTSPDLRALSALLALPPEQEHRFRSLPGAFEKAPQIRALATQGSHVDERAARIIDLPRLGTRRGPSADRDDRSQRRGGSGSRTPSIHASAGRGSSAS
jgi:hypothetical protein